MKDELRNFSSLNIVHANESEICLIPRIHEYIRVMDRDSYEPIVLSIGPYHNGYPPFSSMEREKWNCLDYILRLNRTKGLKDYVTIINGLERARIFYSGDIKMNKRMFLQTLLLDGCFVLVSLGGFNEFLMPEAHRCIDFSSHAETLEGDLNLAHQTASGTNEIELIKEGKQNAMKGDTLEHDIMNHGHSREEYSVPEIELHSEISENRTGQCQYQENTQRIGQCYNIFVSRDLFLLENQIPFFIIEGIYEALVSQHPNKMETANAFSKSIAQYVECIWEYYPKAIGESNRPKDFDHLLHLCHMYFRQVNQDGHHSQTDHYMHHFIQPGQDYLNLVYKQEAANLGLSQDGHFPYQWRRATQYHEAGIKFRRRLYCESNPHSLLDIKLKDGVLEIPFLFVDEMISSLFRNLIALEQTSPKVGNDVTTYVLFMAKLMSMPDDVALLSRNEIVVHHLRTDKEVSQLFTKLTKGVVFDMYGNYYLKSLCLALEAHYQNRMHRWVAWLRHNHFSNPWLALLCFFAPSHRLSLLYFLMLLLGKHSVHSDMDLISRCTWYNPNPFVAKA
uniref:Uncharacterized protein n=1 Tax=Oryza brachyantha TaxID=4533 RepID=J3M4Q4_ORYBR